MRFNTLIVGMIVAVCLWCVGGCDKQTQAPAPEQTKTAAEYKAEAEKEITAENADAELAKLEQAIEQEAAQ
jgi:hypothetical protein